MNRVKISAVGDIMLGDFPACYGFGVKSKIIKSKKSPFVHVMEVIRNTDLLFGNLESVLSIANINRLWLPTLYMRGAPLSVKYLKECNFKLLSIANNHIMQHGNEAFWETIKILEKNQIKPIGILADDSYHSRPFTTIVNKIKIGFLAYSQRPEEYKPGEELYCIADDKKIYDDLKKLKKMVDVIIVSMHWGDEYIEFPSIEQKEKARKIIDNGASVIIGHHPHVIQGIENYKSGLIAYSLGNFVFDMWLPETKKSIIIEIILTKDGVMDYHIIPVKINDQHRPELLSENEKNEFNKKFEKMSEEISQRNILTDVYQEELSKRFLSYRKSILKHYLKNIKNYNIFYFAQLIFLVFIRRFFNKHI